MTIELLDIDGQMVPHTIVTIKGDGACLFASLSYLMYHAVTMAREIREQIVTYVVDNWEHFSIISHDNNGNNYISSTEYFNHMTRPHTYAGACELSAAGQLFHFTFEVFRNGLLHSRYGAGDHPVRRLRFTGDYSRGHFDVYLPNEDHQGFVILRSPDTTTFNSSLSSTSARKKGPGKRRARFTDAKRKKQLRDAAKKYVENNPEARRATNTRYRENKGYVHGIPETYCTVRSQFEQNHPATRQEIRRLPWKVKKSSGMTYNPDVAYEDDQTIALGTMSHKCQHCEALRWKEETPGMCCNLGKVQLPPLRQPPEPIYSLLTDGHPHHAHFMQYIRKYNSCFQMTSFGANRVMHDRFMPTFKVQGQVYHLVGSLLPPPEQDAKFLQICYYEISIHQNFVMALGYELEHSTKMSSMPQ